MTDISKCKGANCSIKDRCYRFTAADGGSRQSWILGVYDQVLFTCKMFVEVNSKSQIRRLDIQNQDVKDIL